MARPQNLVKGEQISVTLHPKHAKVMEQLVKHGLCGNARNVPDAVAALVAGFVTSGGPIAASRSAQILIDKVLKIRKF